MDDEGGGGHRPRIMTADTALSTTTLSSQRRWVPWAAVLLLVAMLALVLVHPGLRGLAAATGREMLSLSPLSLALIVSFKVLQALFTAITWRNALRAAWPSADLSYRFVLGVEQGQATINAVAPARAGTWAMLGTFGLSIPGARAPKLVAVWAVQNLAFLLFAGINYALVAIGLPEQPQKSGGLADRVSSVASAPPLVVGGLASILLILLLIIARVARQRIEQARQQVREGLAILRPPVRYVRLLLLPSLIAYLFTCASCITLLAAFGIPITVWTLALALGSNALGSAVRITPGGVGTSQAIDVIALRDYAAPELVTAYSLSEIAISTIVSCTIAIVALLSVSGWHGTKALILHRRAFATGLQTLSERQRALRARTRRRKRPTSDD